MMMITMIIWKLKSDQKTFNSVTSMYGITSGNSMICILCVTHQCSLSLLKTVKLADLVAANLIDLAKRKYREYINNTAINIKHSNSEVNWHKTALVEYEWTPWAHYIIINDTIVNAKSLYCSGDLTIYETCFISENISSNISAWCTKTTFKIPNATANRNYTTPTSF